MKQKILIATINILMVALGLLSGFFSFEGFLFLAGGSASPITPYLIGLFSLMIFISFIIVGNFIKKAIKKELSPNIKKSFVGIIKNMLLVLVISIVITVIGGAIYMVFTTITKEPDPYSLIFQVFTLPLYLVSGHLLIDQGSKIKNFLSICGLSILLIIVMFIDKNSSSNDNNLSFIDYLISLAPTILMWTGLEWKIKRDKKSQSLVINDATRS